MSQWVRNAVMIAALLVWIIVVLTQLWRGSAPDPVTWGFPGGLYFLLNPALPRRPVRPPEEP